MMGDDASGNLWRASARETTSAPPLSGSLNTELLVIGAGFTGCAAALEATRLGADVTVLEAQTIGHGGSGRNVGLVNAGLWLPPETVAKQMGDPAADRLLGALSQGPETVFGLIARHGIECEATQAGTLHLAHAPAGLSDLQTRHAQANRAGRKLQLLDREATQAATGSQAFHGALLDPGAGTIQPLSYARGLARAAMAAGARFHERTPVLQIRPEGEGWRVTTPSGEVRAERLLIATNAYHEGFSDPVRPRFVPVSYSQFATTPLPDTLRAQIMPSRAGAWDTAMVMSSFRIDQAGRLILGGICNSEGPGGRIHAGWARRKLAQVFPQAADQPFEHAWRGRIAMTSDHVPKILRRGTAMTVFGYSGRGICPGTLFGTALASALLSGDDTGLPLAPTDRHAEPFAGLRGAYYECGATLTHAVGAR